MLILSFFRLLELKMAMREVLRLLLRVTCCGGRGGDEGESELVGRAGKVNAFEGGGGGGSRGCAAKEESGVASAWVWEEVVEGRLA